MSLLLTPLFGNLPGRFDRPRVVTLARRPDRNELKAELELHEVHAMDAQMPGLAEKRLGELLGHEDDARGLAR